MPHAQFNVAVKAILKNTEGQILALGAHDNGPMAGFSDLPGGRVDDTEVGAEFTTILEREIKEELGNIHYKIISPQPIIASSWLWPNGQPMIFLYYEVEYISGIITMSAEHTSTKWVELNEESIDTNFTTYHHSALKQFVSLSLHN